MSRIQQNLTCCLFNTWNWALNYKNPCLGLTCALWVLGTTARLQHYLLLHTGIPLLFLEWEHRAISWVLGVLFCSFGWTIWKIEVLQHICNKRFYCFILETSGSLHQYTIFWNTCSTFENFLSSSPISYRTAPSKQSLLCTRIQNHLMVRNGISERLTFDA